MYLGLDTTGTGRGEWDVMEIMLVVSFLHSVRCTRYFDPGFSFSFGLGFDLWSYSPKRRRDFELGPLGTTTAIQCARVVGALPLKWMMGQMDPFSLHGWMDGFEPARFRSGAVQPDAMRSCLTRLEG